jgi:hypothetical protein
LYKLLLKQWSTKQIKTPDLKYFPSESDGFLNKRSTKKGAPLHHNAALYADALAFIVLSKANLIAGTILVQQTFARFVLEVHLGCTNTPKLKSKTEAMYFPSHSKPMNEIEEELVKGNFVIPGNKFIKFTNKFKYLGTYIAQDLSDDTDIDERILSASKKLQCPRQRNFQRQKDAVSTWPPLSTSSSGGVTPGLSPVILSNSFITPVLIPPLPPERKQLSLPCSMILLASLCA